MVTLNLTTPTIDSSTLKKHFPDNKIFEMHRKLDLDAEKLIDRLTIILFSIF